MPRQKRIYHPGEVHPGSIRIEDPETLHYLCHVVRIRSGDQLILFGGGLDEHIGEVREISPSGITLEITESFTPKTEPSIRIHLGVAVGKGYKLDEVVEAVTALGVTSILPFVADRSISERRNPEKLDRLKKIAISACRQSGRVRVPEISPVSPSLHTLLGQQDWPLLLFADERGGTDLVALSVNSRKKKNDEVALFIGPEGGWSDHERERLLCQRGTQISLGPRILRLELAAVVAVCLVERLFNREVLDQPN